MSKGAIAGIVVALNVLILVVSLIVYFILIHKKY